MVVLAGWATGCASGSADAPGLLDAGAKPPDATVEGCTDQDRDGHGQGARCRAHDCDDVDPRVNPSAVEVCDAKDNDCDGATDEDLLAPDCVLHLGVCAGARGRCRQGAFAACSGVGDYGPDYEDRETRCDGLDNDCDGQTDRDCPCLAGEARACGQDAGECRPGEQRCVEGEWGPCEGETTAADEACDGKDNDCDGLADDNLDSIRPDCPLNEGLCAGASSSCRGALGWSPCDALEYGERWVAAEGDNDCDRLDNDCDGLTDEGCACAEGGEQACGLDVGTCQPGVQTCEHGVWGECRGVIGPADEACDGQDNDCDGQTDEGLPALPCPLQAGLCAGAGVACAETGGRAECDAAAYSSHSARFVSVESAAECDGLDNDCDGLTDEECQCRDGDAQVCGQNVGQCTQGRQTCEGGRYSECDGLAATVETCDAVDNDCDGTVDEEAPTTLCPLQTGTCAGARTLCVRGELADCGAEAYGPAWQDAETFCDMRDNDCDGEIDEGCDCIDNEVQACGSNEGACTRGAQTCIGGRWGPCEGEVAPASETCDGVDEDCNGRPDDAVSAPLCPLQTGVCAGALQVCGGAIGYDERCGGEQYGPRFRDEETDADCDGQDNDCDGETDEACECQPDAPRPLCGTNTGECRTGELLCVAGRYGQCEGEVTASAELCDGLDNDCNAAVDDGVPSEACALQSGVCAGKNRRCGGRDGFLDCSPEDYGPWYRADETDAPGDCDGRDNDCDARVDEACAPPPVLISEVYYDSPGRDGALEFIELAGPAGTSLNGLSVVALDGRDGGTLTTIDLAGAVMPAIGYYLIVDETASALMADIADRVDAGADLQNGPDNLRLLRNGDTIIDALGYGRFDLEGGDVFLGEGMAAAAVSEQSLTRDALNTDTDDNAVDFQRSRDVEPGLPTPRGASLPRLHIALRWDVDDTDLDLHLQRAGADFRSSPGDCYYGNRRPIWLEEPATGPRLERDDTDGLGPEFLDYVSPAAGTYLIQVQYFSDRGHGETTASVGLFLDGELALTVTRRLSREAPGGPYWAVAQVTVDAEGGLTLQSRDEVGLVAFPGP